MINSQSKFSNEVYVAASYNESINVLIDDTSTTINQEDNEYHNNENNNSTRGSEHVSIASMIEIITKKVLDFNGINDNIENIDVSVSEGITEGEIGMLKRYIHESRLDEKQAMAFIAICSTFMIDCINMYIKNIVTIVPDSLVRNVREVIGVDVYQIRGIRLLLLLSYLYCELDGGYTTSYPPSYNTICTAVYHHPVFKAVSF